MKGIKFVISSLLLLLCSLGAMAQNQYSITGTLVDSSTGDKLEAVTVRVLSEKDSSELTGTMTNRDGVFFLKVNRRANYIISASYLGYNHAYKPFTASGNTTVDVGVIEMTENSIELGEAVVMGKKPEVIVKDDTLEYDAGSYKTAENAALEDLLKKLPGVEVDENGKITANGKEIKKILVEGKEFFFDDPTVASRNLPAEMVDKLQVVDRRSEMARMTGFDDGQEETIINLTIRPGMRTGTLGNLAAGLGRDLQADDLTGAKDDRYEVGALFNYMKNDTRYSLLVKGNNTNNMGASDLGAGQFGGGRGWGGFGGGITQVENVLFNMNQEFSPKFSLNTDIVYNTRDQSSASKQEETTNSQTVSQFDKSETKGSYFSDDLSLRMRMEWKPNEKNTVIFRPSVLYNTSQRESQSQRERYRFNENSMTPISETMTDSYNEGEGLRASGNLDFSHRFDKPGRVFSVSLQGSINNSYSQGRSYQEYKFYDIDGLNPTDSVSNQRSENDNNSNSLRGDVSFVEPIGNNNFLQVRYRATTGRTEGINSTYRLSEYDDLFWDGAPMDTAVLVSNRSRSTLRYTLQQRYTFSFKAVRERYNYTIGLAVDPSSSINKTYQPTGAEPDIYLPQLFDGKLPNIMGDSLISRIEQNVTNFSPEINFNYQFSQRTNLRIDYNGETNQPNANQLRDFIDYSDIMNLSKGNPSLKPGYENSLRARFHKYIPETQMSYNINASANYSLNDISSVTIMDRGTRITTYENINGNWGASIMGGFNTPLRNKKFTIGNFLNASTSTRKSLVSDGLQGDNRPVEEKIEVYKEGYKENVQSNISLGNRMMANYRSSLFDLGLNARANYGKLEYTLSPERNQETFNWSLGGSTTWYLPYNTTIESDFNWTNRTGYGKEFDVSEAMWNASIMKQLFNKKYGTGTIKLKIYDILKDRNNISSGPTTNGFRSTMTSTIPSFFMCTFIYKFSAFPGGGSGPERGFRGGDGERRGGPPGDRGGRGGGFGGPPSF